MVEAKLVFGVLAALLLCANARLLIVQGEYEEPVNVETKTYYVLQPSTQGEEVEQVESWSSPQDRTWGSLQTTVLNPFTWFMHQLQQLDKQLVSSFPARDEMVRQVGCSRFRQAMKEYQSANRLVSQIVDASQRTAEENDDEYYSDEYMLEDQEALKLMSLMDDKYMSVYSDEEDVAREVDQEQRAAAADGNGDEQMYAYADESDSVLSTEDAQESHDRAQLIAELRAAEARAGMAAEQGRGGSTLEVVLGSMMGDGHLRTARYTVGRDGVLNREDRGTSAQADQQLEAEPQAQPVEEAEVEAEADDNLDEAVSVADLMMDQVRAAYLRGQREAARARADAAMLAAATQALEGGAAAAAATYDEDGDDVFAIGGGRAHATPRSAVLDPLAALGNLLDALLLGGAPVQRPGPLATAAAERAGVAAAVREQLHREAAIAAREEAAEEEQQRGNTRSAGWLVTSGNTLAASILEAQQEQEQQQMEEGEVRVTPDQDFEDLPTVPPGFMDTVDWSLINTQDGSINWGMVGMLALVIATLFMLTGFMHSWFALRTAMRSASADVMVPVMFEHEGRLAQGFVLLPRGMARDMGDGAMLASMSPRKGTTGLAKVAPPQVDCEIAAAKEEAHRVWGAQQLQRQQAEAAHQHTAPQADASTVVIAAEHVDAQSPGSK